MATSDITNNSSGPKRVRVDGVTVQQHDLKDQIVADEYVAEKTAANKTKLPLRLMKIKPGGAP